MQSKNVTYAFFPSFFLKKEIIEGRFKKKSHIYNKCDFTKGNIFFIGYMNLLVISLKNSKLLRLKHIYIYILI
jgi:hypothetical protein